MSDRLPREPSYVEVWSSSEWLEAATAWADEHLRDAGIQRLGGFEQPWLRPWATVLKAETDIGPVWMKAAGPMTAFEVDLYAMLPSVAPGYVLQPIAVDRAKHWLLLPDGGRPLGEAMSGSALVEGMANVMARYARLQRALIPHVESLIQIGLTDMRPDALAGRFDEAVEAASAYVGSRGDMEDARMLERIAAFKPAFLDLCDRLSGMPALPSIDHNDLHAWNVLLPSDGSEPVLYDWGDSVVSHAFASMLVPLTFMQQHLGLPEDAPELLRIREAYLAEFADVARGDELGRTLELACRVAKVARTLTWRRALDEFGDAEEFREYVDAPYLCMKSLLDDSYFGGA